MVYALLFPHFFYKNKTSARMHKMRMITLPIDNMYIYILSIKRLTSRIKDIRILIFGTIPSFIYSWANWCIWRPTMTGGVVTAEKIHTIGYNLSNCQNISNLSTLLTDLICNYLYQIAHFIYELLHNLRQKLWQSHHTPKTCSF